MAASLSRWPDAGRDRGDRLRDTWLFLVRRMAASKEGIMKIANQPTVGSLFAGIGGFDLGFERAGFRILFNCEIDKHARAVLARHWPEVPCYDDVRELQGADLPRVDVLCGGFPCQDISVAGKRAGLAGERSGLWFEFARLVGELHPEWVVVENVPGLRSSNGGNDLATILRGLAELGYMGSWWSPDAQHFGLAQRRERVFIVGHLGSGRAVEVLPDTGCLQGHPAPRREAGEGVAGTLGGGSGERGYPLDTDRATFIPAIAHSVRGMTGGIDREDMHTLVASPITASAGHHGYSSPRGDGADNLVMSFQSRIARNGRGQPSDLVPALRGAEEGDTADSKPLIYDLRNVSSRGNRSNPQPGDPSPTLHEGAGDMIYVPDVVPNAMSSKWAKGAGGPAGDEILNLIAPQSMVRRLTPTECERLMGFEDGWTAGQADSHRYRQLGNAVAVPVAEWIARRIAAALSGSENRKSTR